jgi:predicted P-loop ATPase
MVPDYEVRDSVNGDLWVDGMTAATRTFMEAENGPGKRGYGFRPTDRDMKAGLTNMSRQAAFHPIQQYLNFCAASYDGNSNLSAQSRVESLWTRYLGSPDDAYHRMTALKFMVACVARAFEPGHKFDYSPILHGSQGVGKSTLVAILAQHWYGELSADFSNHQKLVEQMQGCWIMELPELSSIARGQIEDVKAFISGTGTKARLAYNARAEKYLRQTCFIGSTNDTEFLIDTTGNRRWWPIEINVTEIDLAALRAEVNLLWGAAVLIYREMRAHQPEGYLPLHLDDSAARAQAEELQESVRVESDMDFMASQIAAWLDMKVLPNGEVTEDFEETAPVRKRRTRVCTAQVAKFLDMPKNMPKSWSRLVGDALESLGWQAKSNENVPGWGKPRVHKPNEAIKGRWAREDAEEAARKKPKNDKDDKDDLV